MMDAISIQPLYECFARRNLHFKQGHGVWLISDKGEHYLDFTSGIAVNALGYAHPKLVNTLKDKLKHFGMFPIFFSLLNKQHLPRGFVQIVLRIRFFL